VATGRNSGIWVLDVDGDIGAASLAQLMAAHEELPPTAKCITGGGGQHLYFIYPPDRVIRNSVGTLALGLDIRSDGGGVVAPPSVHASGQAYAWAPGRSPAEAGVAAAPTWLYEAMDAARACPTAAASPTEPSSRRSDASAYANAALDAEAMTVLRAPEGARSATLHKACVKVGGLVGSGALDRNSAEQHLMKAALGAGLPLQEARATTKSGLDFGAASPRDMGKVQANKESRARAANAEAQASRRKRLRDNTAATEWLIEKCGLTHGIGIGIGIHPFSWTVSGLG
jgi:hypothetical protein